MIQGCVSPYGDGLQCWIRGGTICLGLLILVLSLIPTPQAPKTFGNDFWQHMLAYGVLTFAFMQWSIRLTGYVLGVLLFMGMGVIIECLQPLVCRSFDYVDMVANGLGIVCGMISGRIFFHLLTAWMQCQD